MPNLSIRVTQQNVDRRSSQIQCRLVLKSESDSDIRLLSIKISTATETKIQQVLDTDLTKDLTELEQIYNELNAILLPIVKESFKEYHQIYGPRAVPEDETKRSRSTTNDSPELKAARAAWTVKVTHSADAEEYYNKYIGERSNLTDTSELYNAKISTAKRLEARLGRDRSLSAQSNSALGEYLTDLESGAEFMRDYIIQGERKGLVNTSYTVHFECRYVLRQNGCWSEPLIRNHSLTATISPKPWATTAFAMAVSIFGVLLKTLLELIGAHEESFLSIGDSLYSAPMLEHILAAALRKR
jgi:hypothetical protein